MQSALLHCSFSRHSNSIASELADSWPHRWSATSNTRQGFCDCRKTDKYPDKRCFVPFVGNQSGWGIQICQQREMENQDFYCVFSRLVPGTWQSSMFMRWLTIITLASGPHQGSAGQLTATSSPTGIPIACPRRDRCRMIMMLWHLERRPRVHTFNPPVVCAHLSKVCSFFRF